MTWGEFQAEVLNFLDVDGERRGIEALLSAYLRAGVLDFVRYVPAYDLYGQQSFDPAELVPFDEQMAEAIAEYVKAKITRNIDKDLALSQAHLTSYMTIRRRMMAHEAELRDPVLRPLIGHRFEVIMNLKVRKMVQPVLTNVWLTVKASPGPAAPGVRDACAVIQISKGAGIEVLNGALGRIKCVFEAEDTVKLAAGNDYVFDVLVENTDHYPVCPVRGTVKPIMPVTRDYAPSLTPVDDDPPDDVPISVIT